MQPVGYVLKIINLILMAQNQPESILVDYPSNISQKKGILKIKTQHS
jgi:hypothetical protein